MGKYTMRAWHHMRQGWKGNQRGSNQSSAGIELMPFRRERIPAPKDSEDSEDSGSGQSSSITED